MRKRALLLILLPLAVLAAGAAYHASSAVPDVETGTHFHAQPLQLFQTSAACMSCHNGLVTPSGEDYSFGTDWATTMMANSARDPYWHAAVRRETIDHPESAAHIEQECSTCHMPMAHYEARYNGRETGVFEHLPIFDGVGRQDLLAADGVSCTTCHQITSENLGEMESFVGRFGLDTLTAMGSRSVFGPYEVDPGRSALMHSSTGFVQEQADHIQSSELCATCHTLITQSLGPGGEVIGELPEQVPYQEWRHSSFVNEQSCQSCHMPVITEQVPISSVVGTPRSEVSRHTFEGGNFFMQKMLNRYRDDLGVTALPAEMDAAVERTVDHLQSSSAQVAVEEVSTADGQLTAQVSVRNLAGHKLPTAYPSRRAWIHLTVSDVLGRTIFESGALREDGSIAGNNNDERADRYEPHHTEITTADQVQIYEAIMVDPDDRVTTGLLSAVTYIKDNRLLPAGFDKRTAGDMVAVHGCAYPDPDFLAGGDKVTYRVDLGDYQGPVRVRAELWFQPIGYRWARNLEPYEAEETQRFVGYYEAMSDESAVMLAWEEGEFPGRR